MKTWIWIPSIFAKCRVSLCMPVFLVYLKAWGENLSEHIEYRVIDRHPKSISGFHMYVHTLINIPTISIPPHIHDYNMYTCTENKMKTH